MSFRILTDTSANLPTALLMKDHIEVIPFSYFIRDKEYSCLDTEGFDGKKFYGAMRLGAQIRTSQINLQSYLEFIGGFLKNGEDVLFVCMSSGISGSFNCATMAAAELIEQYPERSVRLVDSLGASLGEGILVLNAVTYREQGMSLDDVYNKLEEEKKRMYQVFTVDDLNYLKNTGRVKGATAAVGNMLQIKPILKGNEDGEIVTLSKAMGRRRSIEFLAQRYHMLVESPENQTVGIAHADCAEDARELADLISRKKPPKEILTVMYEPVTGSHVGPGTLALFFMDGVGARYR